MKQWLVAGGLILGDDGLLLVRNRRRNGALDWSPPGGVIDEGETVLAGLTREVEEETGLVVSRWDGPAYEVEVTAPGLGWHLRVEAHVAVDFAGAVRVDDPDGIVVDAAFVDPDVVRRAPRGVPPVGGRAPVRLARRAVGDGPHVPLRARRRRPGPGGRHTAVIAP